LLTSNVTQCAFTYLPGVTERSGLVTIQLTISQGGEAVSLYQEVHVNNAP
jgi:MSHA biogenesis protein MshO